MLISGPQCPFIFLSQTVKLRTLELSDFKYLCFELKGRKVCDIKIATLSFVNNG